MLFHTNQMKKKHLQGIPIIARFLQPPRSSKELQMLCNVLLQYLYVQLFCTYNIIINKKWSYLHAFNSFTFKSVIKVMPSM